MPENHAHWRRDLIVHTVRTIMSQGPCWVILAGAIYLTLNGAVFEIARLERLPWTAGTPGEPELTVSEKPIVVRIRAQ